MVTESTEEDGGCEERGADVTESRPRSEAVSERPSGECARGEPECFGAGRGGGAGGVLRFDIPGTVGVVMLGGSGGRPPFARPLRMVRVSDRR